VLGLAKRAGDREEKRQDAEDGKNSPRRANDRKETEEFAKRGPPRGKKQWGWTEGPKE